MTNISTKQIQQIISDVVESFSAIDQKVIELSNVSNEDFSALNNTMMEHHKTTHEIAGSTTQILENVQKLRDNPTLNKLRNNTNQNKAALTEITHNMDTYAKQVHHLNLDFKHIFIPILNFKQNISTLKFLLTNLKLNQGLISKNKHSVITGLIEKLNVKIENIQAEIPDIANDVETLKAHYQTAIEQAEKTAHQTLVSLNRKSNEMDDIISYIERGVYKTGTIKTQIEQKNQEGFQNLNQVITNLQYHDIIRQKMEHIQDTHKNILNELNNIEKEENIIKKGLDYIKEIPAITEIQAGQLILTNKEYQTAIENISRKLIDTANNLEEINTLTFSIFNDNDNAKIATGLEEINSDIAEAINNTQKDIDTLSAIDEKLQKHIKTHARHYEKLENIEQDISAIINEINKNLAPENEIKTITGKLIALLNDINESRSNIGKIINAHHNNQLFKLADKIQTQQSKIKIPVSKDDKTQFITDFTNINQQINKNCKALQKLDSQLKNTLSNIKYYDLYEHEVEEIINQLNIIYQKILPVSNQTGKPSDLMSAMEKAYTMESQREIHQHNTNTQKSDDEDEDDNLELF